MRARKSAGNTSRGFGPSVTNQMDGPVRVRAQLALQRQEVGLGVDLERERIERVALVAPAGAVGTVQVGEGVELSHRLEGAAPAAPGRSGRGPIRDSDPRKPT